MGTASAFDEILYSALNAHAAWLPITNTFDLGDYGVISNGVLAKMGNIAEFGVTFTKRAGPNSQINFTSKGTRIVKVDGNVEVNAFSDGDVAAKLSVEFSHESAFLIKANLLSAEIQNVNQVARGLQDALGRGWRRKFRVVSRVYTGQRCSIISSSSANSKIELNGSAKALKEFDLGNVAAGISVSSANDIGLELIGDSGVLALAMFKLPAFIGSTPRTLGNEEIVDIETHEQWPAMLPDDI